MSKARKSGGEGKDAPPLAITLHSDEGKGPLLQMPDPRAAIRHAIPIVIEGVLGPLALFYLLLVMAGFRGALIAALVGRTWPSVAACTEASGSRCCSCSGSS